MLETLRFVQGAVAKKDFVPALTHFHIRNGFILGYNGVIALSSPIALDLDATPQALPFIKAISTCEQEVALSLTEAGRLAVKSGGFKAFIPCTLEPYPDIQPEGDFVQSPGGFLDALRRILPFVSEDASRPWSRGVLLRGHSAFATNNIVLVEQWLGFPFPCTVNIPKTTVGELLRIGEEPLGMQLAENSITFYYAGKRWMKSLVYSLEWPDIEKILHRPAGRHPIPKGFFKALQDVAAFVGEEGRVYLSEEGVATAPAAGDGASVALPLPGVAGCFNHSHLSLLEGVAHTLDLPRDGDPTPCMFFGDGLRGAIVGMRK